MVVRRTGKKKNNKTWYGMGFKIIQSTDGLGYKMSKRVFSGENKVTHHSVYYQMVSTSTGFETLKT